MATASVRACVLGSYLRAYARSFSRISYGINCHFYLHRVLILFITILMRNTIVCMLFDFPLSSSSSISSCGDLQIFHHVSHKWDGNGCTRVLGYLWMNECGLKEWASIFIQAFCSLVSTLYRIHMKKLYILKYINWVTVSSVQTVAAAWRGCSHSIQHTNNTHEFFSSLNMNICWFFSFYLFICWYGVVYIISAVIIWTIQYIGALQNMALLDYV